MRPRSKTTRFSYDEQRFVTLGLLDGVPVSIVHTESDEEIRVISFRRATNPMKKKSYSQAIGKPTFRRPAPNESPRT